MTVAAGSYGSLLENGFQIFPHVQPGWRVDALVGAVSQLGTGYGIRNLLPAKHPRHRRVIHIEYAAVLLPHGLRWFEQAQLLATDN